MTDPLFLSASAQRALLKRGAMGATELLERVFERLEAVNPALNAVITVAERTSLFETARKAEQRDLAGDAPALNGLVITIKDAFDVAGLRATGGASSFKARIADEDAKPVARLREAGALILGKTNVPAFSGDFQSYNAIFGTTNNPYDRTRSPGGSSGGAAAAVASGISAFELGSDLGGSIRWPAHACGLFGHKPSWGLVSTYGHMPPAPDRRMAREADLVVAGPLARSANDLEVVLRILAQEPERLVAPRTRTAKGLRVALWLDEPSAPVAREVSQAVRNAAQHLAEAGALIDPQARPSVAFDEIFEVYALLNHAIVAAGLPEKLREAIASRATSFAPDDLSHEALQARGAKLSPELYRDVQARRARIRDAFRMFFERWDVLLCPVAPVAAIAHDHQPDIHLRRLDLGGLSVPYFDFLRWSSLATLTNLPASVAPVMQNDTGLPLGVQIIAGEGKDLQAIAVAQMLEAAGCKFLPPRA